MSGAKRRKKNTHHNHNALERSGAPSKKKIQQSYSKKHFRTKWRTIEKKSNQFTQEKPLGRSGAPSKKIQPNYSKKPFRTKWRTVGKKIQPIYSKKPFGTKWRTVEKKSN